jgi:hypothetical protein
LPATYAKQSCPISKWVQFDGTLNHAVEIAAQTLNFRGLTLRSHVPLDKQFEHCFEQELLQVLSDLTYVYHNIDDTSIGVLPLHVWSMLQRPEGGAVGSYEEGPRLGLKALSQRYAGACWADDNVMRKLDLIIEEPLFENSLSHDGQWRCLMELAVRNQQLWRWYNTEGEFGDLQRPFLQADIGTYNTARGCLEKQQDAVAKGGFPSEEAAATAIKGLRMASAFDPMRAHMHNQFALMKANMIPRWRMGSAETDRVQQGFSVMKPSKEGQNERDKKEVMLRRAITYLAVLQRRFHIYERDRWLLKVRTDAAGDLDRADYMRLFREMVEESNADEEAALMNKEVFDDTLPFRLEVRFTRTALMEGVDMTDRCAPEPPYPTYHTLLASLALAACKVLDGCCASQTGCRGSRKVAVLTSSATRSRRSVGYIHAQQGETRCSCTPRHRHALAGSCLARRSIPYRS